MPQRGEMLKKTRYEKAKVIINTFSIHYTKLIDWWWEYLTKYYSLHFHSEQELVKKNNEPLKYHQFLVIWINRNHRLIAQIIALCRTKLDVAILIYIYKFIVHVYVCFVATKSIVTNVTNHNMLPLHTEFGLNAT